MVDSKDVSVVVQGAVCGTKSAPIEYTKKCCESIRSHLPKAELIISTWNDSDVSSLVYDKCIQTEAPELKKYFWEDMTLHPCSINHHIISSQNGLKQASNKYVIKMRSDMVILNSKMLKYIGKYNYYCKENESWRVFKERLISLPVINPYRAKRYYPYSICDWIQIGLTEDVRMLYDVPLLDVNKIPLREGLDYVHGDDFLGPEQYLFYSLLQKRGLPIELKSKTSRENSSVEKSEKAIAMNLVLMSARKMGVASLKYPNRMYAIEPCLSLGYYTFNEWKRLYNRYAGGKEKYTKNFIEDALYRISFLIRSKMVEEYD